MKTTVQYKSCAIALTVAFVFAMALCRAKVTEVSTSAGEVRHVFVIVLENKSYEDTFLSSIQDPYFRKTLVPKGAVLSQYFGTGHASLDNYISMISGQAASRDTANDCIADMNGSVGNFNNVVQVGIAPHNQVIVAEGCVYPVGVKTLADQLSAAGLSWKAYMGDMGNDPTREDENCGHPKLGSRTDNTNVAEAPSVAIPEGDAYTTRHNPFVYFHSIIDSPVCRKRVVNLDKNLKADLSNPARTPNFSFIVPNLCDDGHDGSGTSIPGTTCANGQPGGLTSVDLFLRKWVPRIMRSDAYRKDGLVIITFDESTYVLSEKNTNNAGQVEADYIFPGQTCCNQQPGPNLDGVRPSSVVLSDTPERIGRLVVNGYGGDRIGALLLSPFIKPGSASEIEYNHYSLLRSLEDIFRLREYLGYADEDPAAGYHLNTIGNDSTIFRPRR